MTFHRPEAPPLTKEALAEWLTTHPPETEYVYQDPFFCLLGMYFSDCGAIEAISEAAYEQLPDYRAIAEPRPHNFGAALERARALKALPPPSEFPNDVSRVDTSTPFHTPPLIEVDRAP